MITLHRLTIRDFKSLRAIDLVFPPEASILIEGYNESGKSSLFEAVFFALYGEPLVTEETGARGRGRAETAIRYDADTASVQLEFDIGDTHLTVERTLRKRGQTTATLNVRHGAAYEQVRGQTDVTRRIVDEMGNLTKDALLNSCFVEQKQLGKLEDMSLTERQAALEQLLNLGKLGKLQHQMEVSREEQAAEEHARERLRLARHLRNLERGANELTAAQRGVWELELAQLLADEAALAATLARQRQEADALDAERARHVDATDRARVVADARVPLTNVQIALSRRDALAQTGRELAEALARCDAAETVDIPRLNARLKQIEGVLAHFSALDEAQQQLEDVERERNELDAEAEEADTRQAEAEALAAEIAEETAMLVQREAALRDEEIALTAELAQLDAHGEKIAALDVLAKEAESAAAHRDLTARDVAEWQRHRSAAAAIDAEVAGHRASAAEYVRQEAEARAQFRIISERAGLTQWLHSADDGQHLARLQAAQGQATNDVQAAQTEASRLATAVKAMSGGIVARAVGAGAVLLLSVGLVALGYLWGAAGLLAVGALAWLTLRSAQARAALGAQAQHAQNAVTTAQQRLTQAVAEENAWRAVGGGKLRAEAERMLRQIDIPIPVSADEAHARLAQLPAEESASRTDEATVRAAREAWEQSRQRRDFAEAQRSDAERRRSEMGDVETEGVRVQSALAEAEAALSHIQTEMERAAEALGSAGGSVDIPQLRTMHAANREQSVKAQALLPGRHQALADRQAKLAERQAEHEAHLTWLHNFTSGNHEARLASATTTRATLEEAIAQQRETIAVACQALQLPSEPESVLRESGAVARELDAQRDLAAKRPTILASLATHHAELAEARASIAASWSTLRAVLPELGLPESPPDAEAALGDVTARFEALAATVNSPENAQQRSEIEQRFGKLISAIEASQAGTDRLKQSIAALKQQLGLSGEAAVLAAHLPAPSSEQLAALKERIAQSERDQYVMQQDNITTAEKLGLSADAVLDYEACLAEERELRSDHTIRRQAAKIAGEVRRRMIAKVLPQTTQNMRQLLPLLTLDRYHDCEITDDYKLLIYDETANRSVAKNVFSGGARDQFSLALRLAFALATLPQELGTTPGFIFLDEPLSSFDSPRSEALVSLLTRGQIHDNFRQIFVISHNLLFDRAAFTHHLRLEYGTVVESTLPAV